MTPLDFHDMGIPVIPIFYRSKRPNTRYLPNGEWRQYQNKKPCRSDIERWMDDNFCNYAVICGSGIHNRLVVIDFDRQDGHEIWLKLYGGNGYADTYTVSSGRGYHYYYFIENSPTITLKWYGGEIKASGYCLIPPSIHPSGRRYEAICPDNEIMTIGSLDEIFPAGLFDVAPQERPQREFDPFNTTLQGFDVCADTNQSWRILDQFSHARKSGDGWYMVECAFHNDGKHLTGWIDDKRNRYGCHSCINGSLSAIDFYTKLYNVDVRTALKMMR